MRQYLTSVENIVHFFNILINWKSIVNIHRLIIIALLLSCGPLHAGVHPDPDDLLVRSKQVMGGDAWDGVAFLTTRYSVTSGGLEGTGIGIEDLESGRHVDRYDLGVVQGADGFDGEQPWSKDSNGAVIVSEAQDELEHARNIAYRAMRAFWYPGRHPAGIAWDRRETLDGRDYEVLRITPRGGRAFELWLDSDTGFVARTVERPAIGTQTTVYDDYRDVGGLMIAHHLRTTEGDARFDTVVTITEVEVNPAVDSDAFAVPEETVSEVEMAGDSVVVPFRLINNHIFIEAELNGQGPFSLLVDTGGANVLVPRAMRRLGVFGMGAIRGRGAGEETVEISLFEVERVTIAGMSMTDQTFYGIDLTSVERAGGFPIDGLVGFEVFKRFAVEIDYEHGRLTLTRPQVFEYRGDADAIPFVFDGRTPQVDGSVDGLEGTFTIDTGSRSALDIMVPFAESHDFAGRYHPRVEAVTGWGVGGPVRSRVTRARTVILGSVAIPGVLMEIAQQQGGSFTDRYRAGNIGGGLLKRFTVTFDYENRRLWMEPNGWFDEPDTFDRSGMWINLGDGGFEVIDVVDGGPATQAGLEAGDLITGIGARPAREWKLYELRQALRQQAPGTQLPVSYLRGDVQHSATLRLAELVP
jgi:hypothetical protein